MEFRVYCLLELGHTHTRTSQQPEEAKKSIIETTCIHRGLQQRERYHSELKFYKQTASAFAAIVITFS